MYRMIIDTETAGNFKAPLVYDFGGVVIDGKGEIVDTFNFVIDDVFNGMSKKMATAYYAEKLPTYYVEIANGIREVVSFVDAHAAFIALLAKYGITEVWAYNAKFDMGALNSTIQILSNGFVREFMPEFVTVKCIMGAFISTLANSRNYAKVATRSEAGNIKCSAEEAYRYISGCPCFDEAHTATEDAKIEAVILWACLRQHRKMATEPKQITAMEAWRKLQKRFAL